MARKWVHWTNEKLVIFSIKPSSHPFWEINSFDHTQILHTQHPDDRSLDAQRAESTRLRPFCGLGRGRFTERIDATRSLSAYLTNNYTPAKSQKLKLLYAIKPDCRHIFDADVRNATMCDTSNSQKNNKHWSSRRKWLSRAAERRLSTCAGGDFCRALAPRWKLSSQQNMMGYYLLMDITYDWAWMGMEYHQGGESKWMARQNQTPQKFCWTLGDLTRKSWPVAHQASHIRGLGRFCRELIRNWQNHALLTLLRDPGSRLGLQRKLCGDHKWTWLKRIKVLQEWRLMRLEPYHLSKHARKYCGTAVAFVESSAADCRRTNRTLEVTWSNKWFFIDWWVQSRSIHPLC